MTELMEMAFYIPTSIVGTLYQLAFMSDKFLLLFSLSIFTVIVKMFKSIISY